MQYVVTKVFGWIIQILEYVDISCNGAKMYLVFFFFPDLFVLYIVLEVSPDVVDIGAFCCLFVVCIYMFGWLCPATYYSIASTSMLGVSHAIQNEKKLQKFTKSDSVYLLYFDAWYICYTLMLGASHVVEVLVLDLLVVV